MFTTGQKVRQKLSIQVMKVIDFEPEFIENVITQWEDEIGGLQTGKFMEDEL